MNSGIKFFDDENGINVISHVPAGNESRVKLPSLIFKQSKIWYTYYFNAEALPPFLQSECHSTLQAVLHAVPSSWSVSLWTADVLGTAYLKGNNLESYEHMKLLVNVLIKTLKEFKGPLNLKNLIYKLLNRTMRKMRYLIDSLSELKPKSPITEANLVFKENLNLLNADFDFLKSVVTEA
mmetsp:Transcript_5971/g.5270  ORF Transcript_5971/g.5270 Transcript_5971/m.5270 type:complete len:180 (+) Transcript_5971:4654-5193(+)